MNINHKIGAILNTSDNDVKKVDELNNAINESNVVDIGLEYGAPYNDILRLIKIKVLMGIDMKSGELEGLIKEMTSYAVMYSSGNMDSSRYTDIYIRTLAGDLTSDYYYLIGETEYTMIDLINRKMLILNNIPSEYNELKQSLQRKTLEVLVVSNYDFRMVSMIQSIIEYLDEEAISEATWRLVRLILGRQIITIEELNFYLSNTNNSFLKKLDYNTLSINIVQHSIHNLSRYYTRIRIDKIPKLLKFDQNACSIALDDFIAEMIIDQKLPADTKIDQREQLLLYGKDVSDEYDSFNMHIKQTTDTIDAIESKISALAQ